MADDLETKVREYCKSHEISFPKHHILSIVGTLILEPELCVEKAVKKTRRLFEASWISANKENQKGKSLLDRTASQNEADNGAEEENYVPDAAEVDTYLKAVSERHRYFVRGLFDQREDLVLDVVGEIEPERLDNLVETWTRGKVVGTQVKDEIEKEFYSFLNDYILSRREEWLVTQVGEEKAQLIVKQRPKLSPISTMEKTLLLLKKLCGFGISPQKISTYATLLFSRPRTIEKGYQQLVALGLNKSQVAAHPYLLQRDPEKVEKSYQTLRAFGLSHAKITAHANLLGRNPETIERNYRELVALGLTDSKIASRADLLEMDSEVVRKKHQRLLALGLSRDKIATNAHLLRMSSGSIERNYQSHIQLLRQNYEDRDSGRTLLTTFASLLGVPPETMEANVQFLYAISVDYNKGVLLGTAPQTKRKKMAWLLQEVFDYRSAPKEQKKETIANLYRFVGDNPHFLMESIDSLAKRKHKLREKALTYSISTPTEQ